MIAKIKRTARRWGVLLSAAGLLCIGFLVGHSSGARPLAAQQPNPGAIAPASAVVPTTGVVPVADPKRPVACVYDNVPISRQEFGDYLISLYADERLSLYVNKRIIEMAAARAGVDVSPVEIEAAIEEDCRNMNNIPKQDFLNRILKEHYHKTPTEWRNDVMKPRLLLARMCSNRITVDENELKQMYDNRYGEKAQIKIIMWPRDQLKIAEKQYGELRGKGTPANPDAAWDAVATKQADPKLAARAGEVAPIGRYSGAASAKVEDIAFTLKVGDVSPIIQLDVGILVVKRVGTIEPVKGVNFEKVKSELKKEVINRKLDKEIPAYFAQLRKEAHPILYVGKPELPDPALSLPPEMRQ